MTELRPCKACAHKVAPNAKACPNCGSANPYPVKAGEYLSGCLVLIVLGAIAMWGLSFCGPDEDKSKPSKSKDDRGQTQSAPRQQSVNRPTRAGQVDPESLVNKTIGEVTAILGNGIRNEPVENALGSTPGLRVYYHGGYDVLYVRGIAMAARKR